MGKNTVVFGFIFTLSLALYVVFTKTSTFRESPESEREPLISLEEFTIFRYKGHKVNKTLSGQLAHFVEPNVLELFGRVRGLRHSAEVREYVSAEVALVYFNGNGIGDILENAEIAEAEFEDNVHVGVKYNRISSDFAEYLPGEGVLQSDLPVVIRGPTGRLEGKNGFRFYDESEDIEIYGPIKGVLQGASIETN